MIIQESLLVFNFDRMSLHSLSYEEYSLACNLILSGNSYQYQPWSGDFTSSFFQIDRCWSAHSNYSHNYIHADFLFALIHLFCLSSHLSMDYARYFNHFFDRFLYQTLPNYMPILKLDRFFCFSPNQDFLLGLTEAHLEQVLYLTTIHLIFCVLLLLKLDHDDDLEVDCGFNLITSMIIKMCDFIPLLNLLCIFYDWILFFFLMKFLYTLKDSCLQYNCLN